MGKMPRTMLLWAAMVLPALLFALPARAELVVLGADVAADRSAIMVRLARAGGSQYQVEFRINGLPDYSAKFICEMPRAGTRGDEQRALYAISDFVNRHNSFDLETALLNKRVFKRCQQR